MRKVVTHNLQDRTTLQEYLDNDGRLVRSIRTGDEDFSPEITTKHGRGETVLYLAPPKFRLDIFNWRVLSNEEPTAGFDVVRILRRMVERSPHRFLNYPRIAKLMGLRVRASWHWPNDLPHHDCEMEIHWPGGIGHDTYVRTPEGWKLSRSGV